MHVLNLSCELKDQSNFSFSFVHGYRLLQPQEKNKKRKKEEKKTPDPFNFPVRTPDISFSSHPNFQGSDFPFISFLLQWGFIFFSQQSGAKRLKSNLFLCVTGPAAKLLAVKCKVKRLRQEKIQSGFLQLAGDPKNALQ